ncbi:MAG: hypothetical protein EOS21_11880 [Mesorhizobium sp.]|nr:MAG: hypothetical protein EOS21_11880 [Mesorhizobium sp.]
MTGMTYSELMGEQPAHLILTLDTKSPIELGDFVKSFTSIAMEYERYLHEVAPQHSSEAQIFVGEVRAGSIIAELIPAIAPFAGEIEKAFLVAEFVKKYADRFAALLGYTVGKGPSSKSELQTFHDAVQAIANDPAGSAKLEAAVFKDGKKEIVSAFKFNTKEAKQARDEIEKRLAQIDRAGSADHERVLMVFTRSDVNNANVGKKSGERVRIEELSTKSLALMYGSELAEERIKHEIREADENVFKKGFVVDVLVKLRNGEPVAYSVTNVHDVVDLPD